MVPNVEATEALAGRYAAMLAEEMIVGEARSPEDLIAACTKLEVTVNATSASV